LLITGDFSHYPNSLFTFMKLLIQKATFFNPHFRIDMTYWKRGFLWKEIDETYVLIIGLITPI